MKRNVAYSIVLASVWCCCVDARAQGVLQNPPTGEYLQPTKSNMQPTYIMTSPTNYNPAYTMKPYTYTGAAPSPGSLATPKVSAGPAQAAASSTVSTVSTESGKKKGSASKSSGDGEGASAPSLVPFEMNTGIGRNFRGLLGSGMVSPGPIGTADLGFQRVKTGGLASHRNSWMLYDSNSSDALFDDQ